MQVALAKSQSVTQSLHSTLSSTEAVVSLAGLSTKMLARFLR